MLENTIIRMAEDLDTDARQVITASLILYLGLYLLVAAAGVSWQSQPAMGMHYGPGPSGTTNPGGDSGGGGGDDGGVVSTVASAIMSGARSLSPVGTASASTVSSTSDSGSDGGSDGGDDDSGGRSRGGIPGGGGSGGTGYDGGDTSTSPGRDPGEADQIAEYQDGGDTSTSPGRDPGEADQIAEYQCAGDCGPESSGNGGDSETSNPDSDDGDDSQDGGESGRQGDGDGNPDSVDGWINWGRTVDSPPKNENGNLDKSQLPGDHGPDATLENTDSDPWAESCTGSDCGCFGSPACASDGNTESPTRGGSDGSGGGGTGGSGGGGGAGGCTPKTSTEACSGQTCGTAADGCGGTIQCGTCSGNDICSAGQCVCPDGDNDGTCDANDACPSDASADSNSDGDGVCDANDQCPNAAGPYGGCPDTSPPSVSADVGGNQGWRNSPATISFSASDSKSGVQNIQFCRGNGCNPGNGQTGNSVTINQEGTTTVRYSATDNKGNSRSPRSITVRIDLSAPGVTTTATTQGGTPYTGGWSDEPVEVAPSCSDQSGLSGCRGNSGRLRLVDGPGVCPGEGDRTATSTYNSYGISGRTVLGDAEADEQEAVDGGDDDSSGVTGTFYVCAAAKDRAANVGFGGASPDAREVKVDTTDPVVSASADSPTNDRRETVNYEVTEGNLASCTASGASVSWSCSESDPDNDNTFQGTCSPQGDMPEGDHDVTVECTDKAGNTGSDSVNMVVDTTEPSVSCDDCAQPDPVKSGTDIRFDPSVSDGLSGIGQVNICKDEQCQDLYCSGDPCSFTTPDNTYSVEPFWVQAVDRAGNSRTIGEENGETDPTTETVEAPGKNFTVKKGIGDGCTGDNQCLLGECTEDAETGQLTCEAMVVPEPGIFLE